MAFFFRKQEEIQKDKYIFCALIAIELFMSFSFLGYIHIAPISLTFAYIPVLIAGCIFGPKEGFFVGAVFGLASMWKASAFYVGEGDAIFSPAMSGKPVESILLSVGARALFGFLVGLMYDFARKSRYPKTGIVLVSTIGRSVHTFCV
ncbi:MAG TPA: ECF transporter S component [Candidatus Blautia excrementipullorum]|nr:ECF transporter S component [Candidatus Blautia excrementipullorum]